MILDFSLARSISDFLLVEFEEVDLDLTPGVVLIVGLPLPLGALDGLLKSGSLLGVLVSSIVTWLARLSSFAAVSLTF